MRVFLFEHICGGGLVGQELPPTLLAEGRAMLEAVAADFLTLGCEVITTRDPRVALDLPGAEPGARPKTGAGVKGHAGARVIEIENPVHLRTAFAGLATRADAALVVAPESDGVLLSWARWMADLRARSLGSSPAAIALAGDKLALSKALARAGVPTPETANWRPPAPLPAWASEAAAVVKPRHGAGSEDTFMVEGPADAAGLPPRGDWIVQPFQPGLAASASLIVHEAGMIRLLVGEQRIESHPPAGPLRRLSYAGGTLPLPSRSLTERAWPLAEAAVRAVPGLRGYVGVDLVLGEEGPAGDAVLEINPRLTTSYVGLRRLCAGNLAAAMLDPAAPLPWTRAAVAFDPQGRCTWITPGDAT